MSQDFNDPSLDEDLYCNLALEACMMAAESKFQNIDLIIRAISYLLEFIEVYPTNYRGHLGMAIVLIGGRMYNQASKYLDNAYNLNPSDEIDFYMNILNESMEQDKSQKVDEIKTKKKTNIDDLLDMSNKFKNK